MRDGTKKPDLAEMPELLGNEANSIGGGRNLHDKANLQRPASMSLKRGRDASTDAMSTNPAAVHRTVSNTRGDETVIKTLQATMEAGTKRRRRRMRSCPGPTRLKSRKGRGTVHENGESGSICSDSLNISAGVRHRVIRPCRCLQPLTSHAPHAGFKGSRQGQGNDGCCMARTAQRWNPRWNSTWQILIYQ